MIRTWRPVATLTALVAAAASLTLLTGTPASAADTTVSVVASADAYSNGAAPSTNYGTSASLASVGSPAAATYLRFLVPATPAGSTLTAASLAMHTNTSSFAGSAVAHNVLQAGDGWTEAGLTYNNRTAGFGPVLGQATAAGPDVAVSFPLTASVAAGWAGQSTTLAVVTGGADDLWLWSREFGNAAYRPTLVLTYSSTASPAPSPTATAPSTAGPSSLFFGDSLTEGCCGTAAGGSWGEVAAKALGWKAPVVAGSGGTGYLRTNGTKVNYLDRLPGVLDANPNLGVLVIEGSGNDDPFTATDLRAAVDKALAIAKAKEPNARIYVVGPYAPPAGGYAAQVQVVRDGAAAAGLPFIDWSDFMKGRSDLLYSDGFHPSAAGHAYLGRRAAGELALAGAPVVR